MATSLYTQREIKRKFLGLRNDRPQAPAGKALVLVGDGGMTVLQPGHKTTHGEAVWGSYHTAFEVDTGMKDFAHTFPSPARGGDVNFTVRVEAGYSVSDPIEVVRQQLSDPEPVLRRAITDVVRQVTVQHDIENSQEALAAARAALLAGNLAKTLPITINTPSVTLDLDAQAKEFLRKTREQRHQTALAEGSIAVTKATAGADQERMKHELEAEREKQVFEMEMARERVRWETELAKERAAHELEIQQMRLEVYKPMIEGGLWPLLAQQLAQNPGDIGRVTDIILQVDNRKIEADLAILQAMIDGNVVEDRHVRKVVVSLAQSLEHSIRSGPLNRPEVLPAGPTAEIAEVTADTHQESAQGEQGGATESDEV